jgi:CRP-like cAMP-binding protein
LLGDDRTLLVFRRRVMAENRNGEYQQGRPAHARVAATNQLNVVCREHGDSSHATAVAVPRLFRGIPPGDIAKICAATRVKHFSRGQILHIESDYVQKVLLITSGFVKITQYGLSGAEVILRLEAPGAVLGAEGLYSCGRYGTTAQAHRPCQALVWEAPAFKALIEPHLPVLHQNMIRLLRDQLRELEERFREVATERVAARVACQLVRLPRQIGHLVNGVVEIGLSREDLAHMTGTTLFTVSRLFSAWEAHGVITSRREAVAICDVGSLRALSEGDCPPFPAGRRERWIWSGLRFAGNKFRRIEGYRERPGFIDTFDSRLGSSKVMRKTGWSKRISESCRYQQGIGHPDLVVAKRDW